MHGLPRRSPQPKRARQNMSLSHAGRIEGEGALLAECHRVPALILIQKSRACIADGLVVPRVCCTLPRLSMTNTDAVRYRSCPAAIEMPPRGRIPDARLSFRDSARRAQSGWLYHGSDRLLWKAHGSLEWLFACPAKTHPRPSDLGKVVVAVDYRNWATVP